MEAHEEEFPDVDVSAPCKMQSRISQRLLADKALFNDTPFSKLAQNEYFQNFTLAVISFNAVWIGALTQWNHKELWKGDDRPMQPWDTIVANVLCAYYTFEIIVRFLAFTKKCNCAAFLEGNSVYLWFAFDIVLVLMMIVDTWIFAVIEAATGEKFEGGIIAMLNLLRLARLARLMRLMRRFPELMTLIKSVGKAFRGSFFILLIVFLTLYIMAIVFTSQVAGNVGYEYVDDRWQMDHFTENPYLRIPDEEELEPCGGDPNAKGLFENMIDSMMTLFTNCVLGDNLLWAIDIISNYSIPLAWLFGLFFVFSETTLLNMLIGILCTVIQNAAEEEQEARLEDKLDDALVTSYNELDSSGDQLLDETEFEKMTQSPVIMEAFESCLGVDLEDWEEKVMQLKQSLFEDEEEDDDPAGGYNANAARELLSRPSVSKQDLSMVRKTKAPSKKKIQFAEFREGINEINPQKDAKILDIELLRSKLLRHNKRMARRGEEVEARFKQMFAQLEGVPPDDNDLPSEVLEDVDNPPEWLAQVSVEDIISILQKRAEHVSTVNW